MSGGAGRDRTGDLLNANQALSQLSYSPIPFRAAQRSSRAALKGKLSRPIGRCRPAHGQTGKVSRSTLSGESGDELCFRLIRRSELDGLERLLLTDRRAPY